MFDRLFRIFKAENDKSQLVIIIVIAFVVQLIFTSLGQAIINSLIQLGISWLAAFLFSKYVSKNGTNSMIQLWKQIYIIMIIVSLVRFLLF